jgi:hypothetical protein
MLRLRRTAQRAAAIGMLTAALSCSWSRFDDVAENAPIVLLDRSSEIETGFGSSLATITLDDEVHLFVGGPPGGKGGAVYGLGTTDQPRSSDIDSGHCAERNDPCYLGGTIAGLAIGTGPRSSEELELCFVAGIGTKGSADGGLLTRCTDSVEYILPVPDSLQSALDRALEDERGNVVELASDRDREPAVIAGWPAQQAAWFYPPRSDEPAELIPPGSDPDESYGATVAVARVDEARILAVGAPEQGHVWLFRSDPEEEAATLTPFGCLGGPPDFGRALAVGPVNDADGDELIVADATNVSVFDARALERLAGDSVGDCSLASLPEGALLTSFGCASVAALGGCGDTDFGAALAVGDLDGDGDGEVVVGAPRMEVRGERRAGAILLFDVEGDDPHELWEAKYLSSAEVDDQLGHSIATPRIEGRHVIAAGGPGNGKVALFYCNSRLPADLAGARCE